MKTKIYAMPTLTPQGDSVDMQYTSLEIHSDDVEKVADFVSQNKVDIICISPAFGFTHGNLDFLLDIKNIWGIDIFDIKGIDSKNIDISAIESCNHIKYLSITATQKSVNLSNLIGLTTLWIDWHSKLVLPRENSNLQLLCIRGIKDESPIGLPLYNKLQWLQICGGSIKTLNGIERFQNLLYYSHSYGRGLQDIFDLTKLPLLRELELDHCKKIEVKDIFEQCLALRRLRYLSCTDLPSLSFLKKMKVLESFRFSDIDIKDGDVTPLLKLKSFGFWPNKKHYSHTREELKQIHMSALPEN
jgi:internalin A